MENFSFYSYSAATVAYFLLLPFSLIGLHKKPFLIPLNIAVVCSFIWAGYITITILSDDLITSDTLPLETIRNAAWFFFLSVLISQQQSNSVFSSLINSRFANALVLFLVFIFILEVFADFRYQIYDALGTDIRLFAHVVFAIIGLMLVEQLYRNATVEQRWAVKFLCLGLGALFTVDFIVYSKSQLFAKVDFTLWNSRGFINALIVPLLAISISRLRNDKSKITVSRTAVFHTTVLFGTGMYLILMSLAGFYIRDYGGDWGEIAQIFFIFLAILLLLIIFVSGKIRAQIKVYFNKHFFHYSYDYRDEWIKLSKTVAQLDSINELSGFIIKTLAGLVDSSGGGLWLKNEQGDFYLAEDKNLGFEPQQLIKKDDQMLRYIYNKQWVIDFVEFNHEPEVYAEVDLSQWDVKENNVWLIIPLFQQNDMVAIVVLTQARVLRRLNWEDHDLLKTVGMQLANALALSKASDELSLARQFEAYNRLSAYIVHDLKNLVAQISLIVKNAEKHKRNPEFVDDSIETLENVVSKMQHLVSQLKKGDIKTDNKGIINLVEVIEDVTLQQAGNKPPVEIATGLNKCQINGEKEKMTAILGHLVQNAQEATDDEGSVKLELTKSDQQAIIKVHDNGIGMDDNFISERLFKPFDTTKGNAGMGIGVYEARDYIVKHNGQIAVESALGVGTIFTIKLPLVRQES